MDAAAQRAALSALMEERGVSLAELSRVLGRNPAYLQQYVRRGTPRILSEEDRAALARYLGVPEVRIGGPAPAGLVQVPRLDIGASAGAGRLTDAERARRPGAFPPETLRTLGVQAASASMIRVEGDSMEPTLADGDEILVDLAQRHLAGRGGIFVIRLDGALLVKRLRPALGGVDVISDNPAYAARFCRRDEVEVLGRVAWLGRAL